MGGADRVDDPVRLARTVADQHGEDVRAVADQAGDHVGRHRLEGLARGDRLAVHEPEELSFGHVHVADLGGARGARDGARAHRGGGLLHLRDVLVERPPDVEGDEGAEPGLQAPRRDHAHVLSALLRCLLCRENDVLGVRQEDNALLG